MAVREMSTQKLSVESGIPISTLTRILGGKTLYPQFDTVIQLAVTLRVSTDYLAGLDETAVLPDEETVERLARERSAELLIEKNQMIAELKQSLSDKNQVIEDKNKDLELMTDARNRANHEKNLAFSVMVVLSFGVVMLIAGILVIVI